MSAAGRAVAEARRWIGTPYAHRASNMSAGSDCLGLFRGVWRALYGAEPAVVPDYRPDWAETGTGEPLWWALDGLMTARPAGEDRVAGDLLLFRMRNRAMAKHLGILSRAGPAARFIHAYRGHGVVESPLSAPWARRIVAQFIFPDGGA